ncbi:MAG: hypothetical protein ACRD2X_27370 [Vicinamibacteraceae bacterium]
MVPAQDTVTHTFAQPLVTDSPPGDAGVCLGAFTSGDDDTAVVVVVGYRF